MIGKLAQNLLQGAVIQNIKRFTDYFYIFMKHYTVVSVSTSKTYFRVLWLTFF